MKNHADIIIVGAGIIGVLQAYALQKRGLDILVIDSATGPGMEVSYANAGQLSFGYSGPWATPGLLKKLPDMLANPATPLRIRPDWSMEGLYRQLQWLYWFTLNTSRKNFERNKRRILNLSKYSAKYSRQLLAETGIEFSNRSLGTLQLFRDQRLFDTASNNDVEPLRKADVAVQVLDAEGCIKQEPALARIHANIVGGFLFEEDWTGDCYILACALVKRLTANGVRFLFNTPIAAVEVGKIAYGVRTGGNLFYSANAIILATGPLTRKLTDPLGLLAPVYPVRGYSITADIIDEAKAVQSTVLDEKIKVAITRLDHRVRLGGTAEIGGFNRDTFPKRYQILLSALEALFPGSADLKTGVEPWLGLRPMTPDGTAIIGKTVIPNLYLNLGHGTLGFTQAAGSAEHLARVISGEAVELDPSDYELERYGKRYQNHALYHESASVSV
ncbi:MAG: D-amino acid dehydrogenase [Candidatus Competibacteraceae bacterium]|nr:D-amino acid dehydrogenase [Candidatus Competibacteraceae bacterium]